jgi:hypothetical protein
LGWMARSTRPVPKEKEPAVGQPGVSAWAEYEKRRAGDEARRRERFGLLAPIVGLLAGPRDSTEAWARGAEGEQHVGRMIDHAVGTSGWVLHDRSLPGTRANIDHLVVVPSGIWVIDTKHYRGTIERHRTGVLGLRSGLFVAGRDAGPLVAAAERQRARVERSLAHGVPVRVSLCFTGARWSPLARPFSLGGVLVTWPSALGRTLRAPGPLGAAERKALAAQLSRTFPPYRE